MPKPDFLLIGPPKTGTTSLHYTLSKNPLLRGVPNKELHFFSHFFERGIDWYFSQFPEKRIDSELLFESTPNYFTSTEAITRIYEAFGSDIKLICTLRNPVDRFISQFTHFRAIGKVCEDPVKKAQAIQNHKWAQRVIVDNNWSGEHRPFSEIIDKKGSSYFKNGIYHEPLKRIQDLFGKDKVLPVLFDDLVSNSEETLNSIQSFLGVAPIKLTLSKQNTSKFWQTEFADVIPEITVEYVNTLYTFYESHNNILADILGKPLNWD